MRIEREEISLGNIQQKMSRTGKDVLAQIVSSAVSYK